MKRKWLGNTIRITVAVAVLAYLFLYKVDTDALWQTVRQVRPLWLLASVTIFGSPFFCGVIRWKLLLRCQGINLPFRHATAICFVGQFFNAFLLGGTGGDVVKAYYVTRETRTHKTEAATSVLVDRTIGLVGLFTVLLIMMTWQFRVIRDYPGIRWPATVAMIIVGSALIVLPLSLWPGLRQSFGWLGRFLNRIPAGEQLSRAVQSYQSYVKFPSVLLKAWVLSVVVHLSNFISTVCLGRALGIDIGWEKFFLCVPVINTIASLPITVSGFGVREEFYRRMFGEFGVPTESAIALGLLSYGTQLVWSIVGGLVYVFWKHEPHLARHAREEMVVSGGNQADAMGEEGCQRET